MVEFARSTAYTQPWLGRTRPAEPSGTDVSAGQVIRRRPPPRIKGMRTSGNPPSQRRRRAETLFLVAAAISFVLSVILWFTGSKIEGVFVGLWVPSILALGAFYFARFVDD